MAQFDPVLKREWWVFQEISRGGNLKKHGQKFYRRMQFNFVSYDDDPVRYIEPRRDGEFAKTVDNSGDPIIPASDGCGRVVGFEFFTSRPFEVHAFNDVDAANNLGQLP